MRRRDEVALWPVYFDSTRTRSEGRKVPKRLAKPRPTLEMIEKTLRSLGMPYRVIPDAAYPRLPWEKRGLIFVKKVKPKGEILKEVAARL